MPLKDAYGFPCPRSRGPPSTPTIAGVRALLGFGADTIERFRAALEPDPDFALARAGARRVAVPRREDSPRGAPAMERARGRGGGSGLTPRERRHVEALALWVAGRATRRSR